MTLKIMDKNVNYEDVVKYINEQDDIILKKINLVVRNRTLYNHVESVFDTYPHEIKFGLHHLKTAYKKHVKKDVPFDINKAISYGLDVDWNAYYYDKNGVYIHVASEIDFSGRDGWEDVFVIIDGESYSYSL